jgi:hypothetical protein
MAFIHVNSNTIKSNRKRDRSLPPLSVRQTRSGKATYAHQIDLIDKDGVVVAKVVYEPEHPLSCGAQVWIETDLTVRGIVDGDNL